MVVFSRSPLITEVPLVIFVEAPSWVVVASSAILSMPAVVNELEAEKFSITVG